MIWRLLIKTDKRCLHKFIYNLGFKGLKTSIRFRKQSAKGNFFPAFQFISVTDNCNLSCQGCWVPGKKKNNTMAPETLDGIISQSKKKGSYFFGILGGEPLLYKPLFEVLKKHDDCYFQLFTNGTLLTPHVAQGMRILSNITPLISFEGDEVGADIRRGGSRVYKRTMDAILNSTRAGLITGVAVSVCKSNYKYAMSDAFIKPLIRNGVAYLWYYIYRPMGKNPMPELCLSGEEIRKLRMFLVEGRKKYDIAIIDSYWDDKGNGLCPAATGLSHHINPEGNVEPCPLIQFACDNVKDKSLEEIYANSSFLNEFRIEIPARTSGCIVMENPQWLISYVKMHNATDTSGRNNEAERLSEMAAVSSHASAPKIREKTWLYRFAKKRAFFGLGAYG